VKTAFRGLAPPGAKLRAAGMVGRRESLLLPIAQVAVPAA
jgi:hypothetical protein